MKAIFGKFGKNVGSIIGVKFFNFFGNFFGRKVFKNFFANVLIHFHQDVRCGFRIQQTDDVHGMFPVQFVYNFSNIGIVKFVKQCSEFFIAMGLNKGLYLLDQFFGKLKLYVFFFF